MKLYLGADHNGYYLKESLLKYLRSAGYTVEDDGDESFSKRDDYPEFAANVVSNVLAESDALGILICGSGQGMCIAANRYKGIRACLGYDRTSVQASRNDDDCNVLCLPARVLEKDEANVLVETWLNTPFAGSARFVRRNKELDKLG